MRIQAAECLAGGTVIPALPLVLHPDQTLDEFRQRRLIRYYLAAGAGGLAVGVHTTQFEIRDPNINLLAPLLHLAAEEISRYEKKSGRSVIRIAGVCGPSEQAVSESRLAAESGYDAVLLSPGGLSCLTEADLLARTEQVAAQMPVIGFYLQPAVGGRLFSFDYWQALCQVKNLVAIKVAPFNRYQTLDVLRAVALSPRCPEIALYTGNDDHIILDLLTVHRFQDGSQVRQVRFVGGLLGHWAVWTRKAVLQLEAIKQMSNQAADRSVEKMQDWLTLASQVTDCNSAIFDTANQFAGCITGIHEILRRQGLLAGTWTLTSDSLGPGQKEEIDRIYRQYPHLHDDDFVQQFLKQEEESSQA